MGLLTQMRLFSQSAHYEWVKEKVRPGIFGLTEVLLNPEWSDVSSWSAVGGFVLDPSRVLMFDRLKAMHGPLAEALKLEPSYVPLEFYDSHTVRVTDNIGRTVWNKKRDIVAPFLRKNQYLKYLGMNEIHYYDEDIVGDWENPDAD